MGSYFISPRSGSRNRFFTFTFLSFLYDSLIFMCDGNRYGVGGLVVAVGDSVKDFKIGDVVGVGCMVDSCRSCVNCKASEEQYCTSGAVFIYNSRAKYPHCREFDESGGAWTQGGYSQVLYF